MQYVFPRSSFRQCAVTGCRRIGGCTGDWRSPAIGRFRTDGAPRGAPQPADSNHRSNSTRCMHASLCQQTAFDVPPQQRPDSQVDIAKDDVELLSACQALEAPWGDITHSQMSASLTGSATAGSSSKQHTETAIVDQQTSGLAGTAEHDLPPARAVEQAASCGHTLPHRQSHMWCLGAEGRQSASTVKNVHAADVADLTAIAAKGRCATAEFNSALPLPPPARPLQAGLLEANGIAQAAADGTSELPRTAVDVDFLVPLTIRGAVERLQYFSDVDMSRTFDLAHMPALPGSPTLGDERGGRIVSGRPGAQQDCSANTIRGASPLPAPQLHRAQAGSSRINDVIQGKAGELLPDEGRRSRGGWLGKRGW